MIRNNIHLGKNSGIEWEPVHYQEEPMKFLYSDSPEYLYNDSLNKAVSYMRVSDDSHHIGNKSMKFGIGMYHINKSENEKKEPVARPLKIILVNRADRIIDNKVIKNTTIAMAAITKGAFGTTTGMPVYGGKACVYNWLTNPNIPSSEFIIPPGKSRVIYNYMLPAETGINAMIDLACTNGFFLDLYVVFGDLKDINNIPFAPYGITIGTNGGAGKYWKRKMKPAPFYAPFDPTKVSYGNIVHYRYMKYKVTNDTQNLIDESWDMRPNTAGKELVKSKGGKCRPFKGDYNVEYAITIPIINHGKPSKFAIIDTQRFGLYAGAAKTPDGKVVKLPDDPTELIEINPNGEGALIARPTITGTGITEYTFTWALSGGSYGDQDFMLIPLGEE